MKLKNFKKINKENLFFYLAFFVVLLIGVWLRVEYITRHLEYDEIWTLTHYIPKPLSFIFSDFATPNNHPLSTLLGKLSTKVFGNGVIFQRLPALFSGIILLVVIAHLTYLITKNRFCTLLVLIFSALNGGLIYYSQTARGYELQVLLILIFTYLLALREKCELKNFFFVIIFSLIGIAAILTLSTSIIFIFPIILIHLSYLIAFYYKEEKSLLKIVKKIVCQENIILGYLLTGGFSLIWFICNYHQYKQGQSHGTSIESIKQFLAFGYGTILYLVPFPVLIMSVIPFFFKKHIKFSFAYFFVIISTFISALIFKAGPPRIYLPLIPIICFAGSYSAYFLIQFLKTKTSFVLKIFFILISFFYLFLQLPDEHKKWFAIDWQKIYNFLAKNLPYNYYIYLPATAGYPAAHQNNFGIIENAKRTPHETGFLVFLQEGANLNQKEITLTGIEPINYNTREISISQKNPFKIIEFPNFNCSIILFSVIPIAQTDKLGNIILMTTPPASPLVNFVLDMSEDKIIVLNGWLKKDPLPATILLKNNTISKEKMLQIEKQSKRHILFFTIKEASAQNYFKIKHKLEYLNINH